MPHFLLRVAVAAPILSFGLAGPASAISLDDAIRTALAANPEIGEAVANREAIEFELRQARGLYLPQVDIEARDGFQQLSSPSTRSSAVDDHVYNRREANVVVQQLLFDGFGRRNEVLHQAARVDGASHRVYERSEVIALNVIREYLEVGLRQRIVDYARENVTYHQGVLSNLRDGTDAQAISIADRQQASERLYSAEARLDLAEEELESAKIRFFKYVGEPIDTFQMPPSIVGAMPPTINEALGYARQNNPTIRAAESDLDAARALMKKANAPYYPKLALELTGRTGDNLEAIESYENELRAELVMRWNIFRGGIDSANKQEQLRRVDEERFGLNKAQRDVEEAVRLAWNRIFQQTARLERLRSQLKAVDALIVSYGEQFKVGERSLLDLLDTQNSRFGTEVAVVTAEEALRLARYQLLATTGTLLAALRLQAPEQSTAYAGDMVGLPPAPEGETEKRYSPKRAYGIFHKD